MLRGKPNRIHCLSAERDIYRELLLSHANLGPRRDTMRGYNDVKLLKSLGSWSSHIV